MNILHDAYEQFKAAGFIMQKAKRNTKYSPNTGPLSERTNEPFHDNATGYVAIVPGNVISVDVDVGEGKDGLESFDRLLSDLQLDYEPTPTTRTQSGGLHYFFNNPYPDLVVPENHGYKNLDIYAGYQTVHPTPGTKYGDKKYAWANDFEEVVINRHDKKMGELFKMRRRVDSINNEYADDGGLSVAIKADEMRESELQDLLMGLPENLDYDTWLAVGMCIYDRYEGDEDGFKLFDAFSKRSANKNDDNYTRQKWESGALKPNKVSFTTLRSIVNEQDLIDIENLVDGAKSQKALIRATKQISKIKMLNTRGELDQDVRTRLSIKLNERYKELKKDDPTINVKQARTIVKDLQHQTTVKELQDGGDEVNMSVYLHGTRLVLRIGDKLYTELTDSAVIKHGVAAGVPEQSTRAYINQAQSIGGVEIVPDYTQTPRIAYLIEDSDEIEKLPMLRGKKNPLWDVHDFIDDREIINDFTKSIWAGKLHHLIELIALSIRFGERKLNRLMLVAPSNMGKTVMAEMMGFQKITMARLLNGLRADKGIGSQVVDGIRATGLLLIDEANKALEPEIKDLDKNIHIDQFGAGGGTQILPLHFTILTSTHSTATRNNSDELYNRFLQIELFSDEAKYHVTKSPVQQRDPGRYTDVVENYVRWYFKEVLLSGDYNKDRLNELQNMYRLPLDNDLDDFLYDLSERIIENTKAVAGTMGDVRVKNGQYYYRNKKGLRAIIEDGLRELPHIDIGKYSDILFAHFMTDINNRVNIGSDNAKCYEVNLIPYMSLDDNFSNDHTHLFKDLDIDEL